MNGNANVVSVRGLVWGCLVSLVAYSALGADLAQFTLSGTAGGQIYIGMFVNGSQYGSRTLYAAPQSCQTFSDLSFCCGNGDSVELKAFSAASGGVDYGGGGAHVLTAGNDTFCDTFNVDSLTWTAPPTFTNYVLTFCFTNTGASYCVWNPTIFYPFEPGLQTGIFDVDDPRVAIAPGKFFCMSLTNAAPFYVQIDPCNDFGTFTQFWPATNVSGGALGTNGSSSVGGQGPIANGSNPSTGGSNTTGSTNAGSVSQRDVRQQTDALLLGMSENTKKIVDAINSTVTNDFEYNYSDQLNQIKTNTAATAANTAAAAFYASNLSALAVTNQNDLTADKTQRLSAAAIAGITASNATAGFAAGVEAFNYAAGVSGLVGSASTALKGVSGGSTWGKLTAMAGTEFETVIDVGSALRLENLSSYMGAGFRTWLRLVLLWIAFVGLLLWYSNEVRTFIHQCLGVSQFQVNTNVPGFNSAIRTLMVSALVGILAVFPSAIVVLLSSGLAVAEITAPSATLTSVGSSAISSVPVPVANLLHALNLWLPLWEGGVFLLNRVVARFTMDSLCGVAMHLMKVFGI